MPQESLYSANVIRNTNKIFLLLFILVSISCSSSDDPQNTELSAPFDNDFINEVLQQIDNGAVPGTSVHSLELVLDDGIQNNTYDIDKLILGKTSNGENDALLIAFSYLEPTDSTRLETMSLYIDIDGESTTGKEMGSMGFIGADILITTPLLKSEPLTSKLNPIYVWTDPVFSPVNSNTLHTGSHYLNAEETLKRAIYRISANSVQDIFGLVNVKAIFALTDMPNENPNDGVEILDSHEVTFSIPL